MNFRIGDGIDKTDESKVSTRKNIRLSSMVAAAFLVVAGSTYAIAKRSSSKQAKSEYSANIEIKREACKLFTLDDAKKLLGNLTSASSTNANAVTSAASTSLCSYSSNDTDPSKLKVLTILVRSTNKIQAKQAYELSRAPNAQAVQNVGQAAYYNPDVSQLNIIQDELLIRIASTTGTDGKGTIKIPKNVGEIITSRL